MKKYHAISKEKKLLKKFLDSSIMKIFILTLTGIYTVSVFATLSFDDFLEYSTSQDLQRKFLYLELVILIFFLIEIMLQVLALGIKGYFSDKWMMIDAVIIIASLALVIYEVSSVNSARLNDVTKVIRAIFRFLRVFLLIRKTQQFKIIKIAQTIRTNAEKITEFLQDIKDCIPDDEVVLDLDWCIGQILSNKIYEVKEEDNNQEAAKWIVGFKNSQRRDALKQDNAPNAAIANRFKSRKSVLPIQHQMQSSGPSIPLAAAYLLEESDSLKFNCFEYSKVTEGEELSMLMLYLFEENDLIDSLRIKISTFMAFVKQVELGYKDNPYHNRVHATDVTQTVNFFLTTGKFQLLGNVSQQQRTAMYIAAAIHDFGHPGLNNVFLVNTGHQFALRYNGTSFNLQTDKSVLESYHVASCYEMLQEDKYNIFAQLEPKEQSKIRSSIISMVLSTDMSQHFGDVAKLKATVSSNEFNMAEKDQQQMMDALLHASDISNPMKPFEVYKEWTKRVLEEFWIQGDQERDQGLKISYLCDRYTTNMAKSQLGFIDFIVRPLFEVIAVALPELQPHLSNLENNKQHWVALADFYDNVLRELNEEKDRTRINDSKLLLSSS